MYDIYNKLQDVVVDICKNTIPELVKMPNGDDVYTWLPIEYNRVAKVPRKVVLVGNHIAVYYLDQDDSIKDVITFEIDDNIKKSILNEVVIHNISMNSNNIIKNLSKTYREVVVLDDNDRNIVLYNGLFHRFVVINDELLAVVENPHTGFVDCIPKTYFRFVYDGLDESPFQTK
jgi:hypothetical protein